MERLRPSAPPSEVERQFALRRYQILDTPPEESFDRITRLAAQLFDVPVALITLVDNERQWHKSCFGVDVREVDRSVSFCAHNLDGDTVMVVEDALDDDRFADNPLVTGPPHIRFYAGVPLITPDGHTLGSLCIIDRESRAFGADQQAQLRDLAAMVSDELKLRREVAERRRWETVQRGQNAVLEQIASGAPLGDVLDATARFIESLFDEAQASLLLLNRETSTLHVGAAPQLPDEFLDAVEGASVDPELGMCARVAHHGTEVATHNIATDMHWKRARDIALAHDLRACWSAPIQGENGAVLGTLALYYPVPRTPSHADQQFVRLGTHLASLALERDRAQEALQESEAKFRSLVERTTDWVWEIDEAGQFTYVSPAVEDIVGHPPEALLGQTTFDMMTPADAEAFEQALAPHLSARTPFDRLEKTVQHRDGHAVVLETSGAPRFDADAQFAGYRGIARDITDRRAAQDALQDSEERFRGLVSNLPGLVYRCKYDEAWTTLYMSRGLDELAGYAVEAFERGKRSFKEIMYPADIDLVREAVREAVDTQSHFEIVYRVCTPDGRIRWIEDIGRPCFDEDGHVQWLDGVMFDVTERKRTEQRLRLLETAVNDATESVLITDSELDEPGPRIVYANPGFEAMTGYQPDEVVGQTPRLLQGPETSAALLSELRTLLEKGETFFGETINYRKDGTPFVNEWSISPVYDDWGAVTHYVAVQRDITDRKQAERALRASEQKYRTVVDNVRDVVFRTDAQGRLMFLNPAWTDITGYSVGESLGKPLGAFMLASGEGDAALAFDAILGNERDFFRNEVQLRTHNEEPRWMELFARPVFDDEGQIVGTSGTLHDVTKWREAEEQMRTALEKERELGRLKSRFVSMASHELRTPLATIQSSAELAALFMERGVEAKSTKHLRRIENNVKRMATLLEDVLIFGRVESGRLPFDPQPMDLSPLASEAVANVQQGTGQSHAIRATGLDVAHPMEADPQLVRLIITNLLSNAVKYSAEGSLVQLAVDRDDRHVYITVSDEGIGIPEADRHRLFEPFHRAENVGTRRGTGLGLAILKEVADLHGGEVGVDSTEGEGSTFWVTLPLRPLPEAVSNA
jgi:PAS domain S-box-containing protein